MLAKKLIRPPRLFIVFYCFQSIYLHSNSAGSVGYTIFMSQFLYLSNWTLYAGSALEGFAAGREFVYSIH